MDIKIIIATHREYDFPKDDIYIPVHAGKKGKPGLGYTGDDTGENISMKNANYCELTALYWGWKNLDCDYIGLVHYRRHFKNASSEIKPGATKMEKVLTSDYIGSVLKDYDVILPKKSFYWIETNMKHYENARYLKDLLKTREIIAKRYPDYLIAFDTIMNRRYAHMRNMFIMKKEILNKYAEWLFDILFTVEQNIDISNYSMVEARVFGFLSELLLDVWILKNEIKFKELPTLYMEKIEWHKKIYYFFRRRLIKGNKNKNIGTQISPT